MERAGQHLQLHPIRLTPTTPAVPATTHNRCRFPCGRLRLGFDGALGHHGLSHERGSGQPRPLLPTLGERPGASRQGRVHVGRAGRPATAAGAVTFARTLACRARGRPSARCRDGGYREQRRERRGHNALAEARKGFFCCGDSRRSRRRSGGDVPKDGSGRGNPAAIVQQGGAGEEAEREEQGLGPAHPLAQKVFLPVPSTTGSFLS